MVVSRGRRWVWVWMATWIAGAFVSTAHAGMLKGFNQAWIKTDYGRQWLDGVYDPVEAERLLSLAQAGGSSVVRMWLFEGAEPGSLLWDGHRMVGVRSDAQDHLIDFLKRARSHGQKVYLTLFDSWSKWESHPQIEVRNRWWNLLNQKFGAYEAFFDHVLRPTLQRISREGLLDQIFAVDFMNEWDSLLPRGQFEQSYSSARDLLCRLSRDVRVLPERVRMSASVILWQGASLGLQTALACMDLLDFHVYDDWASMPGLRSIVARAHRQGIPVVLGEFGQLSHAYDDELQARLTQRFLTQAREAGLEAALAWRLSDVRPGNNPEARFSFEAFGRTRPAWDVFRRF